MHNMFTSSVGGTWAWCLRSKAYRLESNCSSHITVARSVKKFRTQQRGT